MSDVAAKARVPKVRTFKPKMVNFETSARYEGLSLNKANAGKTLAELKLKYAR